MRTFRPISTLLFAAILSTLAVADEERPNIVVILADDMGYGDCSAYNTESKIQTPHIDRLAREGLLFTDAHSASTTCTASRYGLLTGINPARRGVVNGINQFGPIIEEKEVTLPELLRKQGYLTRMVGKWHLGFELVPSEKGRPTFDYTKHLAGGPIDHGFDSFLGLRSAVSSGPYFFIQDSKVDPAPTDTTAGNKAADRDRRVTFNAGEMQPGFVHEQANTRLNDEVIQILESHAMEGDDAKPLFLYYAMLEPHTPWLPLDEFGGKSQAGPYGDYIVQLDHELGLVLDTLKETGLEEDTLVFFSSDNGALWPEEDIEKWSHRANGPLAGGKARPQEGGHRVPFIARWPGSIPAGTTTDAMINHSDFIATFADLLKVDLESAAPEALKDSHSFLAVLNNPDATHQRAGMAVTEGSYREGDWKLTFVRGSRKGSAEEREAADAGLFHLVVDIGETNDLSESNPERKAQLFAAYQAYYADSRLKPYAEQLRARKNQKVSKPVPSGKKDPTQTSIHSPTADEESLVATYKETRAGLLMKQDAIMTEEQRQTRNAARKRAISAQKKGMALRNAIDASANLTEAQKKQLAALRAEVSQLTREHRKQLSLIQP